ncbi:29005_t:CDS:1, partial [Racocetra persica]
NLNNPKLDELVAAYNQNARGKYLIFPACQLTPKYRDGTPLRDT